MARVDLSSMQYLGNRRYQALLLLFFFVMFVILKKFVWAYMVFSATVATKEIGTVEPTTVFQVKEQVQKEPDDKAEAQAETDGANEKIATAAAAAKAKAEAEMKTEEKAAAKDPHIAIKELITRHPNCFSDGLWSRSNTGDDDDAKELLSLKEVGKYELITGDNVPSTVPYDHQCPYAIKYSYNCARNSTELASMINGDMPTDWELILATNRTDSSTECNLSQLIYELGGPIGVSSTHHQHGNEKSNDNGDGGVHDGIMKSKTKRPFNVLMMGNSYLRQVFQAMACKWAIDVTEYCASINQTVCYSLQCIKDRGQENGTGFVEINEVGAFVPPTKYDEGSYQPDKSGKTAQFFRPGVKLPMIVYPQRLSDDLAMVEFGNSIRFYYLFRPDVYKNITAIFEQKFHLDLADVDKLVFNAGQEKVVESDKNLKQILSSTGVWQARSVWPYGTFRKIQERDIGRWFGADNPWITDPPNGHACLPGPPNDETNLLLFLIFSNAKSKGT